MKIVRREEKIKGSRGSLLIVILLVHEDPKGGTRKEFTSGNNCFAIDPIQDSPAATSLYSSQTRK